MPAALTLTKKAYFDKVKGAWWGKCAGVTLGIANRGRTVPSTLHYYSPIPAQHAAGVGLDFTVVWLDTLEKVGTAVTDTDFMKAWQSHLDYWQDEFGYAQWNWAHCLEPPASGTYSNWFHNSTGGAMRADIWPLLLPGAPQVAAAFAARDARIDHGMEGVWAAMFLAALGSAAFFLTDPRALCVIGLAMIPRNCRVARAVKAVLDAAFRANGWLAAREAVLKEVGNPNFSDVAQNMGFFTIGLLYGFQDFETALCNAVNCGYDTEFVGGAIGAVKGIFYGYEQLPELWKQPLGEMFIPGPGLHDLPLPDSLHDIAERIATVGARFIETYVPHLALLEESAETPADTAPMPSQTASEEQAPSPTDVSLNGEPSQETAVEPSEENPPTPPTEPTPTAEEASPSSSALGETEVSTSVSQSGSSTTPNDVTQAIAWADNRLVKPLLVYPPYLMERRVGPYLLSLDAGEVLAVSHLQPKSFQLAIANQGQEPFIGKIQVMAPPGWQITMPPGFGSRQVIAPQGRLQTMFTLAVPGGQGAIEIVNPLTVTLLPESGAPAQSAQFLIPGASCWWVVGTFENSETEGFDRVYAPESRPELYETYTGRLGQIVRWESRSFPELVLNLEPLFHGSPGVCYGQTTVYAPTERPARLVAATNSGVKVWLNGQRVLARFEKRPFRPTPIGSVWGVDVLLHQGPNRVLVKWVRGKDPFAFALLFADQEGRLMPDVANTKW